MMVGQSNWSALPPEIWHIVIERATPSTTRNCLFVSRFFHDLAIRSLFSCIRIFFGAWAETDPSPPLLGAVEEAISQAGVYELNLSWDILQHIIHNPTFAKVVRKLIVHPNSTGVAVFEQRCLMEALKALPNLRSFAWLGTSPPLSSDMVQTLAASCPDLEEFSVPIPITNEPNLRQLTDLKVISFQWQGPEESDRSTRELRNAVEASARTLRSLSVCGSMIWQSPIHTLRDLTHLEVFNAEGLTNLSLLFRHSDRLESFTLGYYNNRELASVLGENQTALPHLTSLKLISYWDYMEEAHFKSLAKFIQEKLRLRRFDLKAATVWNDMSPVLEILPKMRCLEALGLEMGGINFNDEAYIFLRQQIPRNITSFFFCTYFERIFVENAQWVELFADLPRLSFLFVATWLSPIVTMDDLLAEPGGLKLVGHNGTIVTLNYNGDEVTVSQPWSSRKVALRSPEDFAYEDWEWLLRHHNVVESGL